MSLVIHMPYHEISAVVKSEICKRSWQNLAIRLYPEQL